MKIRKTAFILGDGEYHAGVYAKGSGSKPGPFFNMINVLSIIGIVVSCIVYTIKKGQLCYSLRKGTQTLSWVSQF